MCKASTEYGGFLLVRKNFCIKAKVPPSSRRSKYGKYALAEQKISSNHVLYMLVPDTYILIQCIHTGFSYYMSIFKINFNEVMHWKTRKIMSQPRNDQFISNIHEQLPDLLRLASEAMWKPELWLNVERHL